MPDRPLPHQFQRAALAVLLCTNSTLGTKWRADPQSVSIDDLVALGFAKEYATARVSLISNVGPQTLHHFREVAKALQNVIWDGDPPHPPADVVTELVLAAGAKDRERDGS